MESRTKVLTALMAALGLWAALALMSVAAAPALAQGAGTAAPALAQGAGDAASAPGTSRERAAKTGTIRGTLTENAVVVKKVAGATVKIAGKTVKSTKAGRFVMKGVAPGQRQIVITSSKHLTYRSTLVVQAGANAVTVVLDLTALETYKRNFRAYSTRDYAISYQIIHPDVRAFYAYEQYVSYMKRVPDIVSYQIKKSRKLKSWRPTYLNKAYTNVWAITRVLRYHDASGYFNDDPLTTHWAQVEGRWYVLLNWRQAQQRVQG